MIGEEICVLYMLLFSYISPIYCCARLHDLHCSLQNPVTVYKILPQPFTYKVPLIGVTRPSDEVRGYSVNGSLIVQKVLRSKVDYPNMPSGLC